jgi:hypothetical protein
MESAEDRERFDTSGPLNRARNRRILVQGSMRSDAIVIVGVRFHDPAQMHLAQDNDVVHRIDPISRSAKPFCQGEAGALGLSRMPMARRRRVTAAP